MYDSLKPSAIITSNTVCIRPYALFQYQILLFSAGEPKGTWQESWKAMEEMQKKGKIRSLGVSNFYLEDLEELVQLATVPVSAVQNWFDPFHQDRRVRAFCHEHNIRYIGYSSLGKFFFCRIMKKSDKQRI